MKFLEVKYMRRKNLGNYEHEEVELSALIEEGDSVDKVTNEVKHKVEIVLGLAKAEKPENTPDTVEPKKVEKVTKKVTKKATKAKEKKEEKTIEVTIDEIREALKNVYKAKGREVAEKIVQDHGATKSSELEESTYPSVLETCNTYLEA